MEGFERFELTDINGNYKFSELEPGEYNIKVKLKPGYIETYPANNFIEIIDEYVNIWAQSEETIYSLPFVELSGASNNLDNNYCTLKKSV